MSPFSRKRLIVGLVFFCCALFALARFSPASKAVNSLFVATIGATDRDALVVDADADGRDDPGDTMEYTVVISNTGTDALNVKYNSAIDSNETIVAGSLTAPPIAGNDTYTATGNVRIQVPDGATDLLANDVDPMTGSNATLTVQTGTFSSTSCTAPCANNVVISTGDGSFAYNPPPGFEGTDTFTYTITNGAQTNTGTASITVTGIIWFVTTAGGPGDGRLTSPFNCLTGAGCYSASANDPGDNIFLYTGGHTGGITLKNNQKLIGQGASTTLGGVAGLTLAPNSDPLPALNNDPSTVIITTAASFTTGVNVGTGNSTLRGFTIGNTTGFKIASGGSFGTLSTSELVLSGSGGAMSLTNGALAGSFNSVTSPSSGVQGINLSGITGTSNFGSTTISGSATQGILVGTTTANINFGNTNVGTGIAGTGGTNCISLQNNSAGTRTFGAMTLQNNTGSGNALFLSGAGGGNVVAGATNIQNVAGSNIGISIQSLVGGTSVSFGDTSINMSGTGQLVNFGGAASGHAGQITLNPPAGTNTGPGIVGLNNTGTFTVTNGTGGLTSGSGAGAISITGPSAASLSPVNLNFSSVTSSGGTNGINLTNTSGTATLGGGALSAATGDEFLLNGGNSTVSYNGTIASGSAHSVNVTGHTGGTVSFVGAITDTDTGISLTTNTGTTINFTGGLNISTGANAAFTATGGGTVNVCDESPCNPAATGALVNTLTTTTATALNVANTNIGANNLEFKSISSTGGSNNGIILNTTGSAGGPKGARQGSTTTVGGNASGGTISGKSGADNSTTQGTGIWLNSTSNVVLRRMTVTGINQNFGIRA